MSTTVNERTQSRTGDASTLAEMRQNVKTIADDLANVIEKRGRALKAGADAGANTLRRSIRRQPAIAMGVAALAGALLALALVPRFGGGRTQSRWSGWVPSQVSRSDFHDLADSLQRSVARATSGAASLASPLTSSLERLVDAVSKIESKEKLNDLMAKGAGWLQKVRSSAS